MVKAAYRKCAKKWHPDRNRNNVKEATERFKDIRNAYAILSDSRLRKIYTMRGEEAANRAEQRGI